MRPTKTDPPPRRSSREPRRGPQRVGYDLGVVHDAGPGRVVGAPGGGPGGLAALAPSALGAVRARAVPAGAAEAGRAGAGVLVVVVGRAVPEAGGGAGLGLGVERRGDRP